MYSPTHKQQRATYIQELTDDMRYLSTCTCRVNLVGNIALWHDHALSTAYRREILKEDV